MGAKKVNIVKKRSQSEEKYLKQAAAIFSGLLFLGLAVIIFIFIFDSRYQGRIYPRTYLGGVDISGLSYPRARQLVGEKLNKFIDQGAVFVYQGEEFSIPSTTSDVVNPELSIRLYSFNLDKTFQRIKKVNMRRSAAEHFYYWVFGWRVEPDVEINTQEMENSLRYVLAAYEQPAVNARLVIGTGQEISVIPEKGGLAFDYGRIIRELGQNLESLSNTPIRAELVADDPEITQSSAESLLGIVRQILAEAPFQLAYQDRHWEISLDQIVQWLDFSIDRSGQVSLALNQVELENYLKSISKEINIPVKEAKFSIKDGKVVEFQPSQNGLSLQIQDTIDEINKKIVQVGIKTIDLVVKEQEPEVTTASANTYGIRELIGEGRSDFSHSPKNRRHNIAVGASALNGLLIKPEEEFSLVKALGKIDASTGYLPELVIKGNRTIPEYGGGLCQIGTTAFRAALDAGFPITERRNHSYRVSYYEPAGTDATIYDPRPDLKFINDTGHYVLLTTEIDGDNLIFRFYGTSDGRKVEQTKPRIYNLVRPGPVKLVETPDLAPGVKKCTEHAHTGADAEFTRTIIYADGRKKIEVFRSHYKPWQKVCLIGVEQKEEN